MTLTGWRCGLLSSCLWVLSAVSVALGATGAQPPASLTSASAGAVLEKYCVTCHYDRWQAVSRCGRLTV